MASWGNIQNQPYEQDMESPTGFHLRVYKNDAVDIALGAVNQLGTAIRSTGKLVVDGTSDLNDDVDLHGKLDVTKQSAEEVALRVTNLLGLALDVDGKMDVSRNGAFSTLKATNNNNDGLALEVNGRLDVVKDAAVAALEVNNPNEDVAAYALRVIGKADLSYDGNGSAVKVTHSDINETALEVSGRTYIAIDSIYDALTLVNFNANGGALSCQGPVKIKRTIKFTDPNNPAYIDSSDGKYLELNALPGSSHIILGKSSGADTSVSGTLTLKNTIACGDPTLNIAGGSGVSNIFIGPGLMNSNTTVQNRLKCQFGLDHPQSGGTLPIGSLSNRVELAAPSKTT